MKPLIGKVISTKMNKTITVEVERQRVHPLYKKIIRSAKKIKAHSENLEVKVGDVVKIISTRPISKDKHYKLVENKK